MHAEFQQIKFSDADVVNQSEFIGEGEYNPHNFRPFLLHDHGTVVAVVIAGSLQDALDIAADEGKLDAFKISEKELADYDPEEECLAYLGNACQPFDIQTLDTVELPTPTFSFVALFNAMQSRSQR
jgi:hypothetical protein